MESVEAVEKILNYSFENKNLLKESLTVSPLSSTTSPLFERLEFLGDSVLGLAFRNFLHLEYPNVQMKKLHALRSINVCNEKFARVAVKHGLYQFLIHTDDPSRKEAKRVKKFSEAVDKEYGAVTFGGIYGGPMKAPKILADIVESIAGAVYIDVNFDIQRLWEIFRDLLEPIYSLDDLRQQGEPLTILSRLGDELGKRIDIRICDGRRSNSFTAQVFLDDTCIASRHAKHAYVAELLAAKEALQKLSECKPTEKVVIEDSGDAKGKLSEICSTEKVQILSSSLPTTSENPLLYEMTPNHTVTDEDSLQVEPEDVKEKLSEISSTKKLQMQTGSSSLPTVSENPLTPVTTPAKMVIDGDSIHVEHEDAREKLFEICSSETRQMQTGSSSSPIVSENPLTSETAPTKMVIDKDSLDVEPEDVKENLFEICSSEMLQMQSGSSSLPAYETTQKQTVVGKDSLLAEPEDAKGKLFEICSTENLQIQNGSSSLPSVYENPPTYEMTPTKMIDDEDCLHVEPEDAKGKLFEICSTQKLQLQSGSSALPTASENPLTYEMAQKQMAVDKDSLKVDTEDGKGKLLEICATRKLQIQTGSSSLPTASENSLAYEMTQNQIAIDEDSLEVEPEHAKSKLYDICVKKKWPKPIFSVEEGRIHKKRYVCSVKIEIPTIEGTFHMKGDEKPRKKEAENSSAYHMIRALRSSLMSLVIKILEMQESLEEKKNLQTPNCSEEKKRKRKRKRREMI